MSVQEASGGEIKSKAPPEAPNYAERSDERSSRGTITGENSNITVGDSCGAHMTTAQQHAQNYLTQRKIFDLFNFLIGHLLVDEPDDPIEYLGYLLDKCMLFKSGLGEPPLLFTIRHIESMFQSLDPSGVGKITLEQYKIGMKTLGIHNYNQQPVECAPGHVDKETFEVEALILGIACECDQDDVMLSPPRNAN
ncbi:hypothetical protein PV326_011380 [Microctonus aethiopoides]|nr:hypothetical protein PV326_011380 [Microctonus aethiopoides]